MHDRPRGSLDEEIETLQDDALLKKLADAGGEPVELEALLRLRQRSGS